MKRSSLIAAAALLALHNAPALSACGSDALALQVLGSGGPFGYGRASTGYLVWIDGVAVIMVDAGGGTYTRFHEADARVADLELLALSHFHPDHSAEVPALLWIKPTDLLLAGPSGRGDYPPADEWVDGLFGPSGVFRAVTNGKGLNSLTIDVDRRSPTEVYARDGIRVSALGVPHGIVPAVGYRIDTSAGTIVFSSDQNGSDPRFVEFAAGADVLVAHLAVPENARGFAANLHAKPSVWGQIANDAQVGTLVLGHLTGIAPRSGDTQTDEELEQKLAQVRQHYDGDIVVAEDLMCVPIRADYDGRNP